MVRRGEGDGSRSRLNNNNVAAGERGLSEQESSRGIGEPDRFQADQRIL
jgi:hypothetical protein